MGKFRRRPVVIEAEQYTEYGKLVKGMCNSLSCYTSGNAEPHIHTTDGIVPLAVGDCVIVEPGGKHFHVCKPSIFENDYEPTKEGLPWRR